MKLGLQRGTVAVEAYQAEWETCAQETIRKLKEILPDIVVDAQHIRSTAIRNIYAKPIIDIAVGVSDFRLILSGNHVLEENGFIYRRQDHPEQHLYVCGENDFITHHIHVVIYDSEVWNQYINLRDYLNYHHEDAQAYSSLKQSLAVQYSQDRKTYTAMKHEMINEILAKAHDWRNGIIG